MAERNFERKLERDLEQALLEVGQGENQGQEERRRDPFVPLSMASFGMGAIGAVASAAGSNSLPNTIAPLSFGAGAGFLLLLGSDQVSAKIKCLSAIMAVLNFAIGGMCVFNAFPDNNEDDPGPPAPSP